MSIWGWVWGWAQSPFTECLTYRSPQQMLARPPLPFLEPLFFWQPLLSCIMGSYTCLKEVTLEAAWLPPKHVPSGAGIGKMGVDPALNTEVWFHRIPQISAWPALCWVLVTERWPKYTSAENISQSIGRCVLGKAQTLNPSCPLVAFTPPLLGGSF